MLFTIDIITPQSVTCVIAVVSIYMGFQKLALISNNLLVCEIKLLWFWLRMKSASIQITVHIVYDVAYIFIKKTDELDV